MRPGLIKADRIAPASQPRMIALHIPVIDTGNTSLQKIKKMHEELDELLDEFCAGHISVERALSELFDVNQVMMGFLLAYKRENITDSAIYDHEQVGTIVRSANDRHIHKILHYAAERGWQVVRK